MTKPNYKEYLRLIRKVRGGESLSKDELKFVVEFKQDVDTGAIDKIQNSAEFKKLSPQEQSELTTQALDASTKLLFQDPTYKEDLIGLAEEADRGELSEKLTTGLNLALAGTDIITSAQQIKQGNSRQRRARRPATPAPLTADPQLQQAISDAQNGNYDAIRALAPAQRQILDNYLSDLNNAKTASTGQAGNYGALAQVASSRRNRSAQELAPIGDAITARNQGRLDNLLGMKQNENQAIQQSQAQPYPYELQQYQYDLDSANNQRIAGMSNLRSSVGQLASVLPETLAKYSTRKRYNDIYNTMSQYGEDVADMAGKTSLDVASRHNGFQWHPEWLNEMY